MTGRFNSERWFRLKYFRNTPKSHKLFFYLFTLFHITAFACCSTAATTPHCMCDLLRFCAAAFFTGILWFCVKIWYKHAPLSSCSRETVSDPTIYHPRGGAKSVIRSWKAGELFGIKAEAAAFYVLSAYLKLDLEGFVCSYIPWGKVKRCSATSAAPVCRRTPEGLKWNCRTGKLCNESRRNLLHYL